MSRVLIWKKVFPGSEYDIFHSTDYTQLWEHVQTQWHGNIQNWGNKLWFQGIYSAIDTGENEYGFLGAVIDEDQINSEYDFIVLPMANIFYKNFLGLMQELTDHLERIKIPIYVVVCGVQTDTYDDLDELIDVIGYDAKRFIKAVYNSGGEFALRGYYTKEFFERLGFSSAVVTGCPSLYQLGPAFSVDDRKIVNGGLKPVFNGHIKQYERLFRKFPCSVFMDQDVFFNPLCRPDYLCKPNLHFQMNFVQNYGFEAAKLISERRVVMAADMNDWSNYLKQNDFNYSFGSRIHGTIMALLSGIPATIVTMDSRTREMAEFFDIPSAMGDAKHIFNEKELYEIYDKMDYTRFNQTFSDKFNIYEDFLRKHGIVSRVNRENRFFSDCQPHVCTGSDRRISEFSDFADLMHRNAFIIQIGNTMRSIIRGRS